MTANFTSVSDLQNAGAALVCDVSSESDHKAVWSELSIWWHDDTNRPFIAVAVMAGEVDGYVEEQKFKFCAFGNFARCIEWFEHFPGLVDALKEKRPDDLEDTFPDANTLRSQKAAAKRGYTGEDRMRPAVLWLYADDESAPDSRIAKQLEADFGVPWRTALNAIQDTNLPGWAKAFIKALRFFDRKRFHKERGL